MDLRAEESGVWSGHLQRTSEWNGGGLTRGEGASGVTNAERWQVALLADTVALLPLASARIYLLILITALRLFAVSCVFVQFVDFC